MSTMLQFSATTFKNMNKNYNKGKFQMVLTIK